MDCGAWGAIQSTGLQRAEHNLLSEHHHQWGHRWVKNRGTKPSWFIQDWEGSREASLSVLKPEQSSENQDELVILARCWEQKVEE